MRSSHSLAHEHILDHYKHPRNFGELLDARAKAHVANPLCGDELDFFFEFDEQDRIRQVKFNGRGCTLSMAAASMLTEKLVGLTKAEVGTIVTKDVLELLQVEVNPARLKCATLSLEAVQQAIKTST